MTRVRLLAVDRPVPHVAGLDVLDGTPVLDLKPHVPAFDTADAERIGWFAGKTGQIHPVRAGARFSGGA